MAQTKNNGSSGMKWVIIACAIGGGIILLSIISSVLVATINPFEQLKKANTLKCQDQCKTDTACFQKCTSSFTNK